MKLIEGTWESLPRDTLVCFAAIVAVMDIGLAIALVILKLLAHVALPA